MDKNFDYWMELFSSDPEEFERQRVEALTEAAVEYADTPEQAQRALAIVNGDHMQLNRVKDETARLSVLEAQFADHFKRFRRSVELLNATVGEAHQFAEASMQHDNNVVELHARKDR